MAHHYATIKVNTVIIHARTQVSAEYCHFMPCIMWDWLEANPAIPLLGLLQYPKLCPISLMDFLDYD